jgi:hypothetical protein
MPFTAYDIVYYVLVPIHVVFVYVCVNYKHSMAVQFSIYIMEETV